MKTKIKYIILLLLVIQTGYAQEANKFTVKAPDKTFIGAILEPVVSTVMRINFWMFSSILLQSVIAFQ